MLLIFFQYFRIIAFSCETNEVEQLEKLFGGKSALKNYLDKFLSHADAMLFLSKFHSLEKAVQLFSKNCSQKEPEYLEALEALKMDKNRIEKLHKELGFNDLHVLYDTSKDAQTSSEYHKKVDGKEQTLTVAIKGDVCLFVLILIIRSQYIPLISKQLTFFAYLNCIYHSLSQCYLNSFLLIFLIKELYWKYCILQ